MEVTVLGWFMLCIYLAVYPAVWAGIVWVAATPRENPHSFRSIWLSSWRNLVAAAVAAAAWVALEQLRGTVFTGFGWNALGIALHGNIPLIQLSSLTGVGGLSFLTVMTSAIAVATVKRLALEARGGKIRAHFDFTLTIALVVAAFGYGLRQIGPAGETIPLKIAAVQPSIPQDEKWNPAFEQRIYDTLERLTATAIAAIFSSGPRPPRRADFSRIPWPMRSSKSTPATVTIRSSSGRSSSVTKPTTTPPS
jgi:apolipoprotein N-acyltransferase